MGVVGERGREPELKRAMHEVEVEPWSVEQEKKQFGESLRGR